jgi:hypothetical protein
MQSSGNILHQATVKGQNTTAIQPTGFLLLFQTAKP